MRKTYKLLLFVILTALLSSNAFAGAKRGVFYNTMRDKAMGNVGILSAKGATAFINNPALLTRGNVNVSPLSIQFFMNNNFVDLGNFINDNSDSLAVFGDLTTPTIDSIYTELNSIDNRWMKLGIPASAAISIKNIGIAAYGSPDLNLKIDKGIYVPRVFAKGTFDRVITFGYGQNVDFALPGLKGGAAVKIITREETEEIKLGFSQISGGGDAAEDVSDSLFDVASKTGFGIDIGGLYNLNENLEVGVVIADIIGTIDDDDIEPNLKLGANYKLPGRISAEINFVDMFNTDGTSLFTRVHIGAEMDLFIFKIRGGFNQGYPTFGAGINLGIISADFAVWTEEQGDIPGFDGETFLGGQISLGF